MFISRLKSQVQDADARALAADTHARQALDRLFQVEDKHGKEIQKLVDSHSQQLVIQQAHCSVRERISIVESEAG